MAESSTAGDEDFGDPRRIRSETSNFGRWSSLETLGRGGSLQGIGVEREERVTMMMMIQNYSKDERFWKWQQC